MTARFGGVIQRYRVIVAPENAVTLSSFAVTPDRVVSESATTGVVTLTAAAPYGGADVTIEPNRRNIVTVPSIVTVPEGATSATFTIAGDRLNASKERSVDIVATYNGVSATASVTVLPKPTASATPQPVALCASLALAPCLTTNALGIAVHETQDPAPPSSGDRQYFLYTPELNLLAETAPSTATNPPIAYEYIWFAGEPLAQVNIATGEIHYYFTDHLGTPILQTDESARVVWQAEYDPYGTIHATRRGETKHQPLRLPGQEADGATETAYNIYRWYRYGWGRYTTPDPLGVAADINVYRYGLNNPIREIDPLGLDVRLCCRPVNSPVLNKWDHCYIESNTNGQSETWGLYKQGLWGVPLKNYTADKNPPNKKCTTWFPETCAGNKCWTPTMNKYPKAVYSDVGANLSYFLGGTSTGRNSNTFARCLWEKCGPNMGPGDLLGVTTLAPGWDQPCPVF